MHLEVKKMHHATKGAGTKRRAQHDSGPVKSAQITNEITVDETLIARNGGKLYTLKYTTADCRVKSIETRVEGAKPNPSKTFCYPPLEDNSVVTCEFADDRNRQRIYSTACKNWKIHLESYSSNNIQGWVCKYRDFVIRPFSICSNGITLSYGLETTGSRYDACLVHAEENWECCGIEITLASVVGNNHESIALCYPEASTSDIDYFAAIRSRDENPKITNMIKSPLDCNSPMPGAQVIKAKNSKRRSIAVMMPIFDGHDETLAALDSLSRYICTDGLDFDISFFVGLDNPTNVRLNLEVTERYQRNPLFRIIKNEENLGFVENCNNLFRLIDPSSDILLVNSDIIAPKADWIERLIEWAELDRRIGTITPLSNQATIFSFPIPNQKAQGAFEALSASEIDKLLSSENKASLETLVETPSCHGFCTLIMNSRLRLEYLFDKQFSPGYGEENDLSCRIEARGFRNIAAHNIYIHHLESVSFSDKKKALLERNLKTLALKHPGYNRDVTQYCMEDPLRRYRNRALLKYMASLAGSRACILHISHYRGGGTDQYIRAYSEKHDDYFHYGLKPHRDKKGYVELFAFKGEEVKMQESSSAVFTEWEFQNEFKEISSKSSIVKVIIHSLLDFLPYGDAFKGWRRLAGSSRITVIIHDYHWINPFFNLLDSNYRYRAVPWNQKIYDIQVLNSVRNGNNSVRNGNKNAVLSENLEEYIINTSSLLQCAMKVIAPCSSTFKILRRIISVENVSLCIEPHDDTDSVVRRRSQGRVVKQNAQETPIRVAVIGAIGMNKGYITLSRLAEYIRANNIPIQIVIIGWSVNDARLIDSGVHSITGEYREKDMYNLFARHEIDYALFLSQWPETYSYTLSIAFKYSIFPFVLDIGAQAERVRNTGFGFVLQNDKPEYIASQIMSLDEFD